MSWRGTLRSLSAVSRQIERQERSLRHRAEIENRRHQRMADRQSKLQQKLDVLERARLEVDEFNDRIEELTSIHTNCSDPIDWSSFLARQLPLPPERRASCEGVATNALLSYRPTLWQRLTGKHDTIKARLEAEVQAAQNKDEKAYRKAVQLHTEECNDCKEMQGLAEAILSGNLDAYGEAVQELNPFATVSDLGTEIVLGVHSRDFAAVDLDVHADRVIPAEIKSLTASGKLTAKRMPQSKFYELYQDHVCSAVLRLAGELFAILPLQAILVNARSKMVSTQTGIEESTPVLSVLMSRKILTNLNLEAVDPSDAMRNFHHEMGFKRSAGFTRIDPITPDQVKKGLIILTSEGVD